MKLILIDLKVCQRQYYNYAQAVHVEDLTWLNFSRWPYPGMKSLFSAMNPARKKLQAVKAKANYCLFWQLVLNLMAHQRLYHTGDRVDHVKDCFLTNPEMLIQVLWD